MIFFIAAIVTVLFIVYGSLRHAWWRNDIDRTYPRILMYHMISPHLSGKESKFNRLRVPPKIFEKQLRWLKANGWTSMTAGELCRCASIPEKTVVLTFDDGYADNYHLAFPLLKKYGMKATIYLVVNRFDGRWATDKDTGNDSRELNNEAMLTHAMVEEMLASGCIEIGSHTMNHANLPALSEEQKRDEIDRSKTSIENEYGILCESFAYPFGFFSERDVQLVKEAGYTNAVTTQNGYEPLEYADRWRLKRVLISGRQGMVDFRLKIGKGRNR